MNYHRITSPDDPFFRKCWEIYNESFPLEERRDLTEQENILKKDNYFFYALLLDPEADRAGSNGILHGMDLSATGEQALSCHIRREEEQTMTPAGIFAYWKFPGCIFGEHLAVGSPYKGKGIGKTVIEFLQEKARTEFPAEKDTQNGGDHEGIEEIKGIKGTVGTGEKDERYEKEEPYSDNGGAFSRNTILSSQDKTPGTNPELPIPFYENKKNALQNSGEGHGPEYEFAAGELYPREEHTHLPVILEIELPENETARRRENFYKRLGFHVNAYKHFQPPFHRNFPPLEMLILSWPGPVTETLYNRFYRHQKEIMPHFE